VVHGGVYTTAVESAASVGATAAALDRSRIAVGTNNNTDFLRSMTNGTVAVTAALDQKGRTQQLWDVHITDESSRVVERGTVRLENIQPGQ
jgi:uncharacterized protein (TIGR00369 family)